MKDKDISDAEVISESPSTDDLHSAMGAPTETKAPTSNFAESNWNFDAADDEPANSEPAQTATEEEKVNPEPKKAIGDNKFRLSAETATLMYDQAMQMACNLRINSKFSKKFTKEEKQRILEEDLEDKKLDELEEKDRLLKRKWDRYSKQKRNKLEQIPLNDRETKNVQDAFFQYFKVKQIELPPEWVLAFALGGTAIDRIIETEAD